MAHHRPAPVLPAGAEPVVPKDERPGGPNGPCGPRWSSPPPLAWAGDECGLGAAVGFGVVGSGDMTGAVADGDSAAAGSAAFGAWVGVPYAGSASAATASTSLTVSAGSAGKEMGTMPARGNAVRGAGRGR